MLEAIRLHVLFVAPRPQVVSRDCASLSNMVNRLLGLHLSKEAGLLDKLRQAPAEATYVGHVGNGWPDL